MMRDARTGASARIVLIVATALAFGPESRGARPDFSSAGQVIRNARVISLDAGDHNAQAVAIRGDRIVAVGSDEEIQRRIGPATKVIDADGKVLLPGLIDSHGHPLGAANSEADHPIPVFESLADVMSYIAGRVKALRLSTINNAHLHFEDGGKGTIEPGKLADLILVDHDPLS